MSNYLIAKKHWHAATLVSECIPRFFHSSKRRLYELAFSDGKQSDGEIGYSRWGARPLPDSFAAKPVPLIATKQLGFFDYAPSSQDGTTQWYLNFANNDVFSAWASPLFAQDEIQVAEHPALIALRLEAMRSGLLMLCIEDHEPTPILITGVERRLAINTAVTTERPSGLYGNQFRRASIEDVEAATTVVPLPEITNLIAIEAPADGAGYYCEEDIHFILRTAFSGFAAAREVGLNWDQSKHVSIHTGFWGCGAYGGNRVVMILLQMLAADLAAIDQLTFHVGDSSGVPPFMQAEETYYLLRADPARTVEQVISMIVSQGHSWGEGDGN